MSKFYVQCGPIETVLSASTAEQAAMVAIDSALQSHLWIYEDAGLSDVQRRDHLMIEALLHLDSTIQVSERGFDRDDALLVGTPETVDCWHRFMTQVNRLYMEAGLPCRSIRSVAPGPVDSFRRRSPR
jgi:hypothetical protein